MVSCFSRRQGHLQCEATGRLGLCWAVAVGRVLLLKLLLVLVLLLLLLVLLLLLEG